MTADGKMAVAGVVLAGGRSTRMFPGGGDKSLLDLGGSPIVAHVIERLNPQTAKMALNANGDPARFARFGFPVIADMGPGYDGPLAGILSGMRWAAVEAPSALWLATASADAPFIPHDLVARLANALKIQPDAIALAACQGQTHNTIGLWPLRLADDLAAALAQNVRKVSVWASRHPVTVVDFPPLAAGNGEIDPFFNINTPDDMNRARQILETLAMREGA